MKEKKILVSACLAGSLCRYDCGSCDDDEVKELVVKGLAIPVCPEELGGLPTPRPPAEIRGEKVETIDGEDVTEAYNSGAEAVRKLIQDYEITEAILKSKSPMCGVGQIYDGSFSGKLTNGDGILTRTLKQLGIKLRSK